MWRAVVLEWPELPEARRSALRAVVDEVVIDADGHGYVVVDERCPGLDSETLRELLVAAGDGRPHVGVRPVTDTVKRLRDGAVTGTVDRSELVQVASPLVVPGDHAELLGDGAPAQLGELAARLAAGADVVRVEVPVTARRLVDADDLELLDV